MFLDGVVDVENSRMTQTLAILRKSGRARATHSRRFKAGCYLTVSYPAVYPPEAIRQRKVRVFKDWLYSETITFHPSAARKAAAP